MRNVFDVNFSSGHEPKSQGSGSNFQDYLEDENHRGIEIAEEIGNRK